MRKVIAISIFLVVFFLWHGQVQAAIAFDAASNSGSQSNVSSFSWSHSVTASGENTILVVGISLWDPTGANRGVTTVTYNSVTMTQLRSDDNGSNIESSIWYLVNPSTGSNTVAVTLDGTNNRAVGGATSYTGVDQGSSVDAQAGGTVSANPSTNLLVTTVADNAWVVDVVTSSLGTNNVITVGAGQTQRWNVTVGTTRASGGSTEGPKTPAGNVTMSWSGTGTPNWAHSAISLKPFVESFPEGALEIKS